MEATTHITIQNFLTKNGPNHLGTGFDAGGVGEPNLVVRELSAVEVHPTQPDENDCQMAKVGAKDFARNVF